MPARIARHRAAFVGAAWRPAVMLTICGAVMAIGTAWVIAFLPVWDRGELRQFVAPWGDSRRARARPIPVVLTSTGRSAGVTHQWAWECVWRPGACRVAARPAPDRDSPQGYAPPRWSEPARGDALLRPDAHDDEPTIVIDFAFGLPLPCIGMRAEVPAPAAPFAGWRWSGSVQIAPPREGAGPGALRMERQHGLGRLPLTPLWGGLAVNTALWASALGGAMWVRTRVRWMSGIARRDSGRCAGCGYAMGRVTTNACPECGAARELPMTDRAAGWCAAGAALVLTGAVAWGIAADVPVRWRETSPLALPWPTLLLAALGVVLLCGAWARGRVPAVRAPHVIARVVGAVALVACAVWSAALTVEGLHAGWAPVVVLGVLGMLSVGAIGVYAGREPRGGGARFVWAAAVASGAAALWGGLHLVMAASDFSVAFNMATPVWERAAPAVTIVLGAAAGWLVERTLRRPG